MNRWCWMFIRRALVWAILGSLLSSLVGAVLGAYVGFLFSRNWDSAYIPLICFYAAGVGMTTGGVSGALIFGGLSFYCSPSRGVLRFPARFVLVGMVVGTLMGLVLMEVGGFLTKHTSWWSFWHGEDIFLAAICGPAGMILGQLVGAIYTVIVSDRQQGRAERERWGRFLESDYDVFQVSRSR